MKSVYQFVLEQCKTAYDAIFPEEKELWQDGFITVATKQSFGHYQCNAPFTLAKHLKKNPALLATMVAQSLQDTQGSQDKWLAKVDEKGGIVNIFLDPHWLSVQLQKILADSRLRVHLVK